MALLTGAIDRIVPVNGLGELSPLFPPPDLAVNLHGAGPQSIRDLLATGTRHLITHRHPEYPQIPGPPWKQEMHEVKRWTQLLSTEGIAADSRALHQPGQPGHQLSRMR